MSTAVTGGPRRSGHELTPAWTALVMLVLGALVTASVAYVSWNLNRHNENRLLRIQTRQAGALITSQVVRIAAPLHSAVQMAEATNGRPQAFNTSIASDTGPGLTFVSASLFTFDGSAVQSVAHVGVSPDIPSQQTASVAERAKKSKTFVVTDVNGSSGHRIGYAEADPSNPAFVVYAERAIPPNRQVRVEQDSAFADLNFATYLGTATTLRNLATTDVPLDQLPLRGHTERFSIPFGDTTITLVAAPRVHLGGALGFNLPWIFLTVGALLTVATAVAAAGLVRRGRTAARDASTIAGLYQELGDQYQRQRTVAETLQRALLPASLPAFDELEIASRYVAGAAGVDIGGDWYSVLAIDDQRFAFVVGDVSGRGVSAASIMARLRYTLRAYLLEGYAPERVLQMCCQQVDIEADGHFATAVVGVGDLRTREITVANAGHLTPLMVSGDRATYLDTPVGLPLGIAAGSYVPLTVGMPAGSTLICFTDGLVERRSEDIADGLARLARTAQGPSATVEDLLDHLLAENTSGEAEDDVALLAFRWREPPA